MFLVVESIMKRSVLACLAGFLTWVVVVTVINRVLRFTLPGYTSAEHTLAFTFAMKWARLLMSIVTCLAAGALTRWVSPTARWAPWIVGGAVLAVFLPAHVSIWDRFPVWYHLTFLLTILPSVLLGALLVRGPFRNLARPAS
jgi:hypothetical protein